MHIVCEEHKRRVLFFALRDRYILVQHRSDGSRCSLPVMAEGVRIPWSSIDRALVGYGLSKPKKVPQE